MISKEEEVLKCWKDQFEKVCSMEEPSSEANVTPAERGLGVNTGPPTMDEVKKAISALNLKKRNAVGVDEITADMLKADAYHTPNILTNAPSKVWDTEDAPSLWKMGLIVKRPKKDDITNCNNLRGIMPLSATSKVLCRVILNRIQELTDPLLREEQAGFRKGRPCSDQIITLRQIVEHSNEWNSSVYDNFIDCT